MTHPRPPASPAALVVHHDDDVAIALAPVAKGEAAAGVVANADIPKGHKIALRALSRGEAVRRYGWPIGLAAADIAPGDHVHSHNLRTALEGEDDYALTPATAPAPGHAPLDAVFGGYRRADGRVGTRNEIWVIATVGCVARTAQRIAEAAARRFEGRVDGVVALTHPFGCSQLGDDLVHTRTILAALAGHPNAGGVLIVGLGCESNQIGPLLEAAPDLDPSRLKAFSAQAAEDEIEAGLEAVGALVAIAEADRREPCPVSDLVVGMKCGGSDGFSGLSANPLTGRITDILTGAGGRAIITEIPEIFGAEHTLLARADTEAVFGKAVDVINGFKRYFLDHDQPIYENPSPGNKEGGITTLEEKSMGAVQKAGGARLMDVIGYGERATAPGLTLLEAPGNDAVSSTALTAAGATVIVFTTGRGTPLGFPAPTLKIASGSALAERKSHWIDFDAGPVLAGEPMPAAAERLFELILRTASGEKTRNEINGEREIAIWKSGVTL